MSQKGIRRQAERVARQQEARRRNKEFYQSGMAVKLNFGAGTKKGGGGKKG